MHNYGQSLGYGNVVVVAAADDADHLLFPDFLFEPAAAAGVVDVLD